MTDKHEQFKQVLDQCHEWPCSYLYKFILPTESLSQLVDLFPEETMKTRESKTGKYTSVTMETHKGSAQEVMDVYTKASQVSGLMSL